MQACLGNKKSLSYQESIDVQIDVCSKCYTLSSAVFIQNCSAKLVKICECFSYWQPRRFQNYTCFSFWGQSWFREISTDRPRDKLNDKQKREERSPRPGEHSPWMLPAATCPDEGGRRPWGAIGSSLTSIIASDRLIRILILVINVP